MMGGYVGKLLRVDLSSGSIREEPLPSDDILRKYIGGLGLGAKIIYDEVPPPGTTVMSSPDWTVVSIRHELDSKTIHGSHSHGYWGAYLKMNGFDGIIFQGAAASPVYLWIHDGKVELRDASRF